MDSKRLTTTPVLVAAFLVSTAFFLFATFVTAGSARNIGRAAREIATVSTPAGSSAGEVRASLRRLDVALASHLGDNGIPPVDPELDLDEKIARVDGALARFLTTPAFASERPMRTAVQASWGDATRALAEVRATARLQGKDAARRKMGHIYGPAAERFDASIVRCQDANAVEARTRATFIATQWARTERLGVVMTVLSVLLTAGTAFLAIRRIREQTTLLARRADESVQFAGRVAHDVLAPLSPIRVFFDVATKHGLEHPLVARALAPSRSSLQRLVGTVDALLSFAKAGARPPSDASCAVEDVVRGVLDDTEQDARTAAVDLSLADLQPGRVRCAPGVLSSVLSNLVRNAIRYMGVATERRVLVAVRDDGRRFLFEVTDTGPGIEEGWQRTIFEPLVRGRATTGGGIGLGLATVKRLVTGHGGEVGLYSQPGAGSRFWFSLPKG